MLYMVDVHEFADRLLRCLGVLRQPSVASKFDCFPKTLKTSYLFLFFFLTNKMVDMISCVGLTEKVRVMLYRWFCCFLHPPPHRRRHVMNDRNGVLLCPFSPPADHPRLIWLKLVCPVRDDCW